MIIILVIAIIVVLFAAWVIPAIVADLQLDIQLYNNKAGGVDFVTVNLLDWAAFWAPIIPAALVTGILLYPKKFLSIVRIRSSAGRTKLAIVFSVIVFAVSYAISWLTGELSYGMFMAQYLQNDPSFVPFLDSFKALLIPFDLSPYDENVLLTWKYITLPIINAVLTAGIIRMAMEMVGARVNGGFALEFLGRLFLVIGLVLGYFYMASPLSAYDSIEQTWLTILPLTMWTLVSVGAFCLVFCLVSKTQRDREELAGAGFILTGIVIIAMVVVPCIVAASDFFSRELRYEQVVWNGRAGWEVNQTRVASDLTGFQQRDMNELLSVPTNPLIADRIRPFDKNSSTELLEQRINTPYETKDDTDIIVLNQSEYWVAPRSFYSDADAFGTAINLHVRYTNTQGFVAMDAHTGKVLQPAEYPAVFGVNSTYPFYFGEGPRQDLILHVSQWTEVHGQDYSAPPDAVLGGYLSSIKVLGMSTDFITLMNQDIEFLHRTNIFDRVEGMLLPYMYMDEDPYLVFDPVDHRVHYCVPLYISIPGFTYFKTDYKRFIGWVILDVYSGEMDFYRSPTMDEQAELESLISFARVYVDTAIYPWQNSTAVPAWLRPQLRYPENFYESQLEADYTYHVTDWRVWHDKSDFFDRPAEGDLYYVMMDLGEGLEFVGVELVVPTSGTTTLAGMYVLRNRWDRFGETIFYRTPTGKTLIGPKTAEQTFITNPGISSELTLVTGRDTGNILLYEFAGSLYYVIPIYTTTGSLQDLRYVGLVNGLKETEVVWSETAKGAFDKIAKEPTPPANIYVNSTGPASVESPALANVSITVQNTIVNLTIPPQNLTLSMYVYSQDSTLWLNNLPQTSAALNDTAFPALGTGANYTIGNWSLAPSELRGLTVQLNLSLGNFSFKSVPYRVVATLPNGTQFSSPLRSITFYSENHSVSSISGGDVTLGFTLPTTVAEPNNASLVLSVKNDDMNFSHPPVNVKVNLTLFSVNGTVRVPGMTSIENASFSSDDMYPGIPGWNYTVIDRDLTPQEISGITVVVDLDITGNTRVELVYRLALIVNDVEVATTLLRVIIWTG
ncbi:MAG: UPF0182 family protein [Candidatus Lokiarchaeota archaeon]|nr:UPF0182 family protein [Candidatus Lokiarchaeota archaeon]